MSVASFSLNIKNQFDMSVKYLNRTGTHQNESLNTKEVIFPERRLANIQEAETVLSGLPTPTEIQRSFSEDVNIVLATITESVDEIVYTKRFVNKMVYEVMQNVVQDDFIDGWEEMNLYNCVSGSFELHTIIKTLFVTNHKQTWQSAVSLRLEEKLIASKRALHNLDRVHDAYNNARPLLNGTVTPEGRYDSFYFTSALFPQNSEINETYIRLREHIQKYMRTIDDLVRIYNADDHRTQTSIQCFNYSDAFLKASVEYKRDLRKYESLVIRKPLKGILSPQNDLTGLEIADFTHQGNLVTRIMSLGYIVEEAIVCYNELKKTHITDTIEEYLGKMKHMKFVSKLDLAGEFTSSRVTQLVEHFTNTVSRIAYHAVDMSRDVENYYMLQCFLMNVIAKKPLQQLFFAKMYGHYHQANGSEKANMDSYFFYDWKNALLTKLVRGEFSYNECKKFVPKRSRFPNLIRLLKALSLRNLTSFKNKMESFLEVARMDDTFFRYVLSLS